MRPRNAEQLREPEPRGLELENILLRLGLSECYAAYPNYCLVILALRCNRCFLMPQLYRYLSKLDSNQAFRNDGWLNRLPLHTFATTAMTPDRCESI